VNNREGWLCVAWFCLYLMCAAAIIGWKLGQHDNGSVLFLAISWVMVAIQTARLMALLLR